LPRTVHGAMRTLGSLRIRRTFAAAASLRTETLLSLRPNDTGVWHRLPAAPVGHEHGPDARRPCFARRCGTAAARPPREDLQQLGAPSSRRCSAWKELCPPPPIVRSGSEGKSSGSRTSSFGEGLNEHCSRSCVRGSHSRFDCETVRERAARKGSPKIGRSGRFGGDVGKARARSACYCGLLPRRRRLANLRRFRP
jgi:hypothetical protein